MISFTVRLTFDEGDREAITGMLRHLITASRQEPGCVSYYPNFVQDEPLTVLIYEQYADEAALEAHRNSAHFAEYAAGGLYKLKHTRQLERLIAVA